VLDRGIGQHMWLLLLKGWTQQLLAGRLPPWLPLISYRAAFVDTRSPGSTWRLHSVTAAGACSNRLRDKLAAGRVVCTSCTQPAHPWMQRMPHDMTL
jgi:hypothetical protein